MSKRLDLIGKKFGRLLVISLNEEMTKAKSKTFWNCKCECGNTKTISGHELMSGKIKSCGCFRNENNKKMHIKHNGSGTKLYKVWCSMRGRCNCVTDKKYNIYGGRGITICEEWNDFKNFNDWALANGYREGLTIDRIDVNGNYEPSNCRWVNNKVQSNNRRNNIIINIDGVEHTLMQWCEILKPELTFETISRRYHKEGFKSVEQLFNRRVA